MAERSASASRLSRTFAARLRRTAWRLAPLAALLLSALPAAAQIDPFSKVGFEPTDVAHQLGSDTINPLTGLLVRNETIMGPFTAPRGYTYSIVAHYSGPNWRAYSRAQPGGNPCILEELHRPEGLGSLGFGWDLSMGRLHGTRNRAREYVYESPTGELVYFHPAENQPPGCNPRYPQRYESADGRFKLLRTIAQDDPECVEGCEEVDEGSHHFIRCTTCEKTTSFVMYGPDGIQYSFGTTYASSTSSQDPTANSWNFWCVDAIKTMAGDVIRMGYVPWAPQPSNGTRFNLSAVSDGTRTITFTSGPYEWPIPGSTEEAKYTLIDTVSLGGAAGTEVSFSYVPNAIAVQSPLGSDAPPLASDAPPQADAYRWNTAYESVKQRPRPFLSRITYPLTLYTGFSYNETPNTGHLTQVTTPFGGVIQYGYEPILDPGFLYTEGLGITLRNWDFGSPELPACTSLPQPKSTGSGITRMVDISVPFSDERVLWQVQESSNGTPEDTTQECYVAVITCDENGAHCRQTGWRLTLDCSHGEPSSGGTPGGTTHGAGGEPNCDITSWTLRQTAQYGVSQVTRDGASYSYTRCFEGDGKDTPSRLVYITRPDQSVESLDYGGPSMTVPIDNLCQEETGDAATDARNDFEYLMNYLSGQPRSSRIWSPAAADCQAGPAGNLLLQETRTLYESGYTCYTYGYVTPRTLDIAWTLHAEPHIRRQATRSYGASGALGGYTEILAANTWDSANKALGDQKIYFRTGTGETPTTNAEMESPGAGWTLLQSSHTEFDPIVDLPATDQDPNAYWLLGRVKKQAIAGYSPLHSGSSNVRIADSYTNARGQVVLEVKEHGGEASGIFMRYYLGDDGQVQTAGYGVDGFPGEGTPYAGCGSAAGGGVPPEGGLPSAAWGELDGARGFPATGNGGSESKTVHLNWDFGYPLSMKWEEGEYDEICRTWDAARALPSSDTDPNGVVSTYTWDSAGRLRETEVRDPGTGGTTRTTIGWPSASHAHVTDGCGADAHYLFDGLGRLRETWTKYPSSATGTSWSVVAQSYDGMGRVREKTEPFEVNNPGGPSSGVFQDVQNKAKTTYAFDALGRVTDVSGPAGFHQAIAYDGLKKTVTMEGIQTPSGNRSRQTHYYSDPLGRLILVDECEGADVDECEGADAVYSYNVAGQLTEARTGKGLPAGALETYLQSGPGAVAFSKAVQTRTFSFDSLGRLTSETHPESGTTRYTLADGQTPAYDPLGNLLEYEDAKGQRFGLSYDFKGRKTGIVLNPGRTGTKVAQWAYDEVQDVDGTGFGLSLGRLTTSKYWNAAGGEPVTEFFRYTQPFARMGRKEMRVLGHDGYVLDYEYTPCGQEMGRGALVGPAGNQSFFTAVTGYVAGMPSQSVLLNVIPRGAGEIRYAPSLGVKGFAFMNGAGDVSVAHEAQGVNTNPSRIASITLSGPSAWTTGTFSYDGAGNITAIGQDAFSYDRLSRLKTAQVARRWKDAEGWNSSVSSFTYGFDAFGNLISRDYAAPNPPDSYSQQIEQAARFVRQNAESTFAEKNQLTRIETGGGAAGSPSCAKSVSYDANGNMERVTGCQNPPQTELLLAYDPLNRLARAEIPPYSTQYYYYNADGERVAVLSDPSDPLCEAAYFLRSGSQVAAEEHFRYENGLAVSNTRKAYLYTGNSLTATEEWEEAIGGTSGGTGDAAKLASGLCLRDYAQRAGLRMVAGLSDPEVTMRNNALFGAAASLQNVSGDLVGMMARLARLKPQGNGGGSGENGNGIPQDDEDKVECRYFLAEGPGLTADFVFRRFALASNQSYGTIEPLSEGSSPLVSFDGLQADRTYRLTLYGWTAVGSDANLGYNRMVLEESTLSIEKEKPPKFASVKHFERESETGLEQALRATWEAMEGVTGYNVLGKGPQGQSVALNDALVTGTTFEAPLRSLRTKGVSDTSALSVQGIIGGGGTIGGDDAFPRPGLRPCKGGGGSGDPAPTAPRNLNADNLSTFHGGAKVYVSWEPGFVPGSSYRIYRAATTSQLICSGASFEQIGTTNDLWFTDTTPSLNAQLAYAVQAVSADGTQVSSMSACVPVTTYPESFAPPEDLLAINVSTAGTLSGRQVSLTWSGTTLARGWTYKVAKATHAVEAGLKPCSTFGDADYTETGQSRDPSYLDTSFGADENPLVGYRVALYHENVGLVSGWSDCAMTHAGACATRPPTPGSPGSPNAQYNSQHNTVELSWAASNCSGCAITNWVYLGDLGTEQGTLLGTASQNRYSVPVIWPSGGNFTFSVVAVDDNTGCRSNPGTVGLVIPPNPGCSPPDPPARLTAEVQGQRVRLSWDPVQNCFYRIYKATGDCANPRTLWKTVSPSTTAVYDTLQINSSASYSVKAVRASDYCESTTESPCASATIPPPPPPGGLVVEEVFRGGTYVVQLQWAAVEGAIAYGVYRMEGSCPDAQHPASYAYLGATGGSPYVDATFTTPGITMGYAVTAFFEGDYETPKSSCAPYARPTSSSTSGLPPLTHYFVVDHLGTPRVTLNALGEIVSTFDGESYGLSLPPYQNAAGNTHTFTGHEYDASTGLVYAHSRMLLPNFARWASPDKISTTQDRLPEPQKLNRYVYASNNPVLRLDMDGKSDIVYDGRTRMIYLYASNGGLITYDLAYNRAQQSSKGKWPEGTYQALDTTRPHFHGPNESAGASDADDAMFGPFGIVRAKPFEQADGQWREGMGIHSGRETSTDKAGNTGAAYSTNGCIRTTTCFMDILAKTMAVDPLKTITVQNNTGMAPSVPPPSLSMVEYPKDCDTINPSSSPRISTDSSFLLQFQEQYLIPPM